MKIIALHGIHTASADPVVPRLFPFLPYPVVYPNYGFIYAVESRRINPVVVGTVMPFVEPDDILLGHSNGCSIIDELLTNGIKCKGVVYINGALTPRFTLPAYVKFAHVYWNEGDDVTILAMLAAPDGLVALNWGELGHVGYLGNDKRVTVNDGPVAGLPALCGHSDIFTVANIAAWGPVIGNNIKGVI